MADTRVKTFSLPRELKAAVASAAAAEFTNESEFIRRSIVKHLAEIGRLSLPTVQDGAA
jgi:Arc/MetJ-type ribon-helix-helix transcriptional regulator